MTTTVKDRQSLFDIALITAGSIEAVFDIAADNELSITAELEPNTELALPKAAAPDIVNHYKFNKLSLATELELAESHEEGIEYWRVTYDFAVS